MFDSQGLNQLLQLAPNCCVQETGRGWISLLGLVAVGKSSMWHPVSKFAYPEANLNTVMVI
jgi:hypothetical protein